MPVAASGPWLVVEIVGALMVLGVAAAVIARRKGRRFAPWCLYGVGLPAVALPHAVAVPAAMHSQEATARAVPWIVLALGVINVVLVDFHRALFGGLWQYVMWEGGVLEVLTPLNFLLGAAVFLLAAAHRPEPRADRLWLVLYAIAEVVLAGEEISWGRGQILLDLNDPNFVTRYNPQHTLHSGLPGWGPIAAFFVIVAALRLLYPLVRRILRLPLPVDFLNAVLLTAPFVLLMRFSDGRYLFIDEVYEWSSSVLLLCLALHARWGWFFRR